MWIQWFTCKWFIPILSRRSSQIDSISTYNLENYIKCTAVAQAIKLVSTRYKQFNAQPQLCHSFVACKSQNHFHTIVYDTLKGKQHILDILFIDINSFNHSFNVQQVCSLTQPQSPIRLRHVKPATHATNAAPSTNRKSRAAAPLCLCFESSRSTNIVAIGYHNVIHVVLWLHIWPWSSVCAYNDSHINS